MYGTPSVSSLKDRYIADFPSIEWSLRLVHRLFIGLGIHVVALTLCHFSD